jgi:hypothetical protein
MTRGQAPRDLIEAYLDELRGGLRGRPGEAEMILAEAEDHLRETAAGGPAVLAAVVMTAWKLVSLLLLAGGASGMAIVVVTGFARRVNDPGQLFLAGPGPYRVMFDHLTFNPVSGVWKQTAGWADQHPAFISRGTVTWLNQPFPGWHAAVLLACYGLARRCSLREPLAGLFPAVAVSVFGAIALALLVLDLRVRIGTYDARPVIAACLAVTLGYAVRLGQLLLRQR